MISGHGGQGVVWAGRILAKILFAEGYKVLQTQSYGAEARGGTCKSEVIASDDYIYDIVITQPEYAIIISFEAYNKFVGRVKAGGVIIVDSRVEDEIDRRGDRIRGDLTVYTVPARRVAAEMGNSIVANSIMLGFFLKKLAIVDSDRAKHVLRKGIAPPLREINVKAFEAGWNLVCCR